MEKRVYRLQSGEMVTDSVAIAEAMNVPHYQLLRKICNFQALASDKAEGVIADKRFINGRTYDIFCFTWEAFSNFIETFKDMHRVVVKEDFRAEFWKMAHEQTEEGPKDEVLEVMEGADMNPVDEPQNREEAVHEPEHVPTPAEVILKMANALYDQEHKIKMLEEKMSLLAQTIAEVATSVEAKSYSDAMEKAHKEMSARDEVDKLVEAYAEARFISIPQARAYMYSLLQTETDDIIVGERHGYTSKIHEIECKGYLPKLLDIARRLTGKK